MSRIKIIYNPTSGKGETKRLVELLSIELLHSGHEIALYETSIQSGASEISNEICEKNETDLLLTLGGDGSLNQVINGMMNSRVKIPIAIYPSGTMNDFAHYLKIPRDFTDFLEMIKKNKQLKVDVGRCNDINFINVVSCGIFSEIAHSTPKEMKNIFGPLAYYLEGLKTLSLQSIPEGNIEIVSNEFQYEGKFILFMVSNSTSIGGFHKMAPLANISDGILDCILLKSAPLPKLFELVVKVFTGEHLKSEYVEYFQTTTLTFNTDMEVDIDGEYGGRGEMKINIEKQIIEFLY
jgi:diacylglycerol kinase (ATP)